MAGSITLQVAVEVLTQRPCSGEPVGWATRDFCDAVAAITGNTSEAVRKGYAGALMMTAPSAKAGLTSLHPDLARAVQTELEPAFEGKTNLEAVEIIRDWADRNTGKFAATLSI